MYEAFEALCREEGVYSLLLTADQAQVTLRALAVVAEDDPAAAVTHSRPQRMVQQQQPRTEEEDRVASERRLPPYDLSDADALQVLATPVKGRRRPRQKQTPSPPRLWRRDGRHRAVSAS